MPCPNCDKHKTLAQQAEAAVEGWKRRDLESGARIARLTALLRERRAVRTQEHGSAEDLLKLEDLNKRIDKEVGA